MREDEFLHELKKININISDEQINMLRIYKNYLQSQNELYNLTALISDEDIYLKHFYDSIVVAKYYNFNDIKSITDIGTGAGFPGVIIKIFFPNLKVYLVDSNGKKIKFLNELIKLLNLNQIVTINSRIEDLNIKTDVVIARAVGSISYLAELSYNVYQKDLILMRGRKEEISQNLLNYLNLKIIKQEEYLLPISKDIRNIMVFNKKTHNVKYPRKYILIKKQPL